VRVVETFPHAIREIENCWIPMSDGCRLAARIWLPESAEQSPVPAIVEYLPYRKRVGTRWRDEPMHRYFAGHGYAAVRIDLRGSGESDGLLLDEYLPQEQADGVEAIRWIARQAWCTGSVGMMGKSWGGFNSLQVAALAPPELKAVLTVCSTDDRYADDAHFMGGCLLNENLIWGSVLQTINAQAPDPELVGERWREMWLERLAKSPLFAETWLRHQLRDEYWCHGSVCEDFRAIRCPVYAVGGWADGYTNAVPRLLAGLDVPRKGLVGPWAHLYPHEGVPGPAIGFLQEALRWWDQWLKGRDTGILDEPMLRVWMQEGRESSALPRTRPGRWVAEEAWPSPRIEPRRMVLAGGGRLALERGEAREERLELAPSQTVGVAAGAWCGFGVEGETPDDQREDDARSLVFDSEPLAERVEVLGAPLVHLELAIDRPLALVAVRLNELDPRGRSTRVTYGLANLTHRRGHERSEPARPGERFAVRVRLNDVAHSFAPGNRLRVAVSTSYWPVVWPSPEPVRLSLFAGASALELPVRPPRPADGDLRPFPPPEAAPPLDFTDLEPGGFHRRIERDAETGALVHVFANDVAEDGEPRHPRALPHPRGRAALGRGRDRAHDDRAPRGMVDARRDAHAAHRDARDLRAPRRARRVRGHDLRALPPLGAQHPQGRGLARA
jgi:hypothetical protein